jgi:hypothetical protein
VSPAVTDLPPATPPASFPGIIVRAIGGSQDFHALGYSHAFDDEKKKADPDHVHTTFVFRYVNSIRTTVARLDMLLSDLWAEPGGPLLAVGTPKGVLQIDAHGVTEVSVPQLTGYAMSIWGPDAADLFVSGGPAEPFIFYRRQGQWHSLPMPPGAGPIYDGRGMNAHEVYFVGEAGQILLWDGRQVSRLPTPTTRPLAAIARLNDLYMCAAGYDGTLLMGNRKGWRIIPTNTSAALLSIVEWGGKVYYLADDALWSFDGQSAPVAVIDAPGGLVNELSDGLVISEVGDARLYSGGALSDLDCQMP